MKRVFLIVLDSCGAGAMPDSEKFGDVGVHTLRSCASSDKLHMPNLCKLGIGNIDGQEFLGKVENPTGAYARLAERSMGKDTTIGHWEIAGLVSPDPLPVYPEGFPEEVLKAFEEATGRGCLCNLPYSGTDVIRDYGEAHLDTGKWIIYTSADSVFQVAAHEELVSLDELYDACHKAREILRGKHGVGRVIARPFVGDSVTGFKRTSNRHDYSLEPPARTLLDAVKESGKASIGVGKIYDIFAGIGTTEHVYNTSNQNGMEHTDHYAAQDFEGLCFVNLVDFDMVFGHRRNIDGYANALSEFDAWLGDFLPKLREDDILMITADHGCDPAYTATTDHTREYVPLIVAGPKVKPVNLGTRVGFCDIAATVAELLNVELETEGVSFAGEII
ncbi:MAG: phosphopentomutase [Oscillospiraceae bacterium]|nr:phosphopentomutase [Oscillospiraceae bacterium]